MNSAFRSIVAVWAWYGVAAILLGYALVTLSIVGPKNIWYQLLNITGALGVAIDALYDKDYQPAVLNIVWFLVALIAIMRAFTY